MSPKLKKFAAFTVSAALIAISLIVLSLRTINLNAQAPERFAEEIARLDTIQAVAGAEMNTIVFTGSSSIRMWKDVAGYFPGRQVINTGFGGSHFSDLIHYRERLIDRFQPDQVFIYEGDNDIAGGKWVCRIMRDTRTLIKSLEQQLPGTRIVLISPKPSLDRWALKDKYERLNRRLSKYARRKDHVAFADVWTVMLNEQGTPKEEIFIEDGLHMNKAGYDLWAEVLNRFIL